MKECLYTAFFKDKPEDEATIQAFAASSGIPVEQNLKAIQDRTEFLSEIIEYRFGIFFSKLFTELKHEPRAFPDSPYTPDWSMLSANEKIIAEVFRLNSSRKDALDLDYSDKLAGVLHEIAKDFLLKLEYQYEQLTGISHNLTAIKSSIENWLITNPELGTSFEFNNEINFTVRGKDSGLTKVNIISPYRAINFDYRRLTGEKSRLFSKLKYATELSKSNIPYIVCMHLTFESWFDTEDVYQRLYGSAGILHDDEPFEEFYPGAVFHDISSGLYYSNELIKDCVSGILVSYQGNFSYFPNYSHNNRLSPESKTLLDQFLYKELTKHHES